MLAVFDAYAFWLPDYSPLCLDAALLAPPDIAPLVRCEARPASSNGLFRTGGLIVDYFVMSPRSDDSIDTLSTDRDSVRDPSKPSSPFLALLVDSFLIWPLVAS